MENYKTDLKEELATKKYYAGRAWEAADRLQYWAYLRGRIAQLHSEAHPKVQERILNMYSFCFRRELRAQRDIHSAVFHSKN